MTEARVAYQVSMFGGEVVAGDIDNRVEFILRTYPEAQDDYNVMDALYYWEFGHVADFWRGTRGQWVQWWCQVPSPKTLHNRAGEIQNRHPELESEETRKRRALQAKQGRVK